MFRAPTLFNRSRNRTDLQETSEPDPFYAFHREMNRLFDDFFDGFGGSSLLSGGARDGARSIHIDVRETKKGFELEAELPGVDEDDVDVELTDNMLTISGEKKIEETDEDGGARRMHSSFRRSMSLPFDVDPEKIDAKFKNGVLKLTLPKPPELESKTKKISIRRD